MSHISRTRRQVLEIKRGKVRKLEVQSRKSSTRITGVPERKKRKNGKEMMIREMTVEHFPEYKDRSFWIVPGLPV